MRHTPSLIVGALTLAVAATACGGSSSAGQAGSGGGDQATVATVAAQSVSGVGNVLVDANGQVLYTPDQESSGTIACTGSCLKVWMPVTVPAGSTPKADSDVTATLATVSRSDGTAQVTASGRPLYTFAFDKSPGKATGDGVTDAFGSHHFTWHVVSPSGDVAAASPSPSSSGGYNYSY